MSRFKKKAGIILILFLVVACSIGIITTKSGKNIITTVAAKYLKRSAMTTEDGRFEYTVLKDGSIEITDCLGTDTEVVIPSIIEGKNVTRIGNSAFSRCTNLISVQIPESVVSIGSYAFYGCSNVENINIPNSITIIEDATFMYCYKLSNITIPSGVTSIGKQAFYGCSITNIEIPSGVVNIGSDAFNQCSDLISIKIPAGVTTIENSTFSGCSSLTSIEIPTGVTTIGSGAFFHCSSLINIEIPETVTSIGNHAFYVCESLRSIKIPNGVTNIGTYTFAFCRKLTNIEMANSVTSISDNAFYCCNSLESVEISEGVITIGKNAFESCKSLTTIKIPSTLESIGDEAFAGCSSLKEINVVEGNKNYSSVDGVLFNSDKTEIINYPIGKEESSYQVPNGVKSIARKAFEYCNNLTSIVIPNGVTNIGDWSFYSCENLKNINLPKGITSIGSWTFSNCDSIVNIEIPDGVISIEDHAFYGCETLESISIPSTVTSIGDSVFYHCQFQNVKLPEGLTNLGGGAFNQCYYLKSINIPEKITNIGYMTFNGCDSLTEIDISNNITSIGGLAFADCESLSKVQIPASVLEIGYGSFASCENLKEIIVVDNNPNYSSFEGVLFDKGKTEIIQYPAGKEETFYKISEEVTSIVRYAFGGCDTLNKIIIPKEVTSIGEEVFEWCGDLAVYCKSDSVAYEYAINNNVLYVIDDQAPTITSIQQDPSGWVKESATLIVSASDDISGLSLKAYSFDGGETWQAENSKVYEEITEVKLAIRDAVGNIYIHPELVMVKIDKEEPEIESVTGNPEEWINKDITLTVNGAKDIKSGLAEMPYSFDGGKTWQAENTKIYKENTNGIIIKVKDAVGNEYTHPEINITKIDKEAPEVENVTGNPEEWLNKNITLTINGAIDEKSGLAEKPYSFDNGQTWQAENRKIYEENTHGIIIKVKDALGNEYTHPEINITKIDKEAPEIESVTGNPEEWTNKNVTLTINGATDAKSGLAEMPYSFDNGQTWQAENTKTYEENIDGIVIKVRDTLGNTYIHPEINITKIDKEGPEVESVTGDSDEYINENITLTINGAKDLGSGLAEKPYSFDGGETWQAENTKTYEEITGVTIAIKDALGNTYIYPKLFMILIDKEAPKIESVTGIPYDWVKEETTLTINATDALSGLGENSYSFDGGQTWQAENSKTYTENTDGINIQVRDKAGNITEYTEIINITKIMKAERIEITTPVDKANYEPYEDFDPTGLEIVVEYDNGYMEQTTDYTVVNGNNLTCLVNKIQIQYNVNKELRLEVEIVVSHIEVIDEKVEATCTKTGLTEGKHCEICNMVLVEQQTISVQEHDYSETVTYPTCIEGGYTTYQCKNCDDSYITNHVGALDHSFTNYISNDDAKCEEDGTKTAQCDRCEAKDTVTEIGTALGHEHYEIVTEPTCTEKGYTTHKCTRCDDTYLDTYVSALDHGFSSYESNNDATCTKDGTKTSKCDRCEVTDTVIEIGSALGHNHQEIVTPSTCTEKGYITQKCTRCDNSYIDKYLDILDHSFTNYESNNDATCTEDGTMTAKCDRCEATQTLEDVGTAKGHTEVIDKGTKTTCTETGLTEGKHCSECGVVLIEQEVVPAAGHDYYGEVTPPTCTERGYTTHICIRCEDSYVDTYVDELDHNFINYISNNDATCTQDGTKTSKCSRCTKMHTIEDEGTMKPHNYINMKCTDCGKELPKIEITSKQYETDGEFINKIKDKTKVGDLIKNLAITNATEVKVFDQKNNEVASDKIVGTGMSLVLKSEYETKILNLVVTGDATGDGKADFKDIVAINRHRLNKKVLEGVYLMAGDATGDNKSDFKDIVKINRFRLNKITQLFSIFK